jgi:hypothetical protein
MNPIDAPLLAACAAYGRQTRGQCPTRVALGFADGSEVTVPVTDAPPPPAPAAGWPHPDGWDFRPSEAAFNGARVKVGGKLWKILRLLAERPGHPVTAERLKREVWGEEPEMVEDSNLHGHVSQLRKRLRDALGMAAEDNPVTQFCGVYRLTVH